MGAATKSDGDAELKAKVFISYSRKDIAFVDDLDRALKAHGFETLIDRTDIKAFEDWWKRVEALIGRADIVVFVLSPDAVASDIALKEVTYAARLNKRLAPIVCRAVESDTIPEMLRQLNFIFFNDPDRFTASVDQLAVAIQTDITWIRKHSEYGGAARVWSGAGRPAGLLLRSPALEESEHWIASRPRRAPQPTAEIQDFISESRAGTTRRRNILSGSLAVGLFIAIALALFAFSERQTAVNERRVADGQRKRAEEQQQIAETQRRAAEKETVRSLVREARLYAVQENYGASLASALRAYDLAGSKLDAETNREIIRALHHATMNTREKFVFSTNSDAFKSVSFSPDGTFILAISNEPTERGDLLRLWNTEAGTLINEYELDAGYIRSLKFSDDTRFLAINGASSIFVFDVLQSGIRFVASTHTPDPITFLGYSEDGQYLITGALDGRLQVRDPKTLTEVASYAVGSTSIGYANISGHKLIAFTSEGTLFYADFPKIGSSGKMSKLKCLSFRSDLGIFKSNQSHLHFYIPCGFIYARLEPDNAAMHAFKLPELPDFVGGGLVLAAASQIDRDDIALLSSQDGTIYLFSDGVLNRKFASHPQATFLSKGIGSRETASRMFLSASRDYTARLWKDTRDTPIASLVGHSKAVLSATLAPKGKGILTAGDDHTARLWSLWPRIFTLAKEEEVTRDCNRVVVRNSRELTIRKDYNDIGIYDAGTEIQRFRPPDGGTMQAFCLSLNGNYLLMGTQYGQFNLVEIGTWETVARFDLSALAYGSHTLKELKMTQDGKDYVAFFGDVTVKWPVMDSSDDLLVQSRALLPKTPATDNSVRTKVGLGSQ